jgi:hypothetical protein
MPFKTSTITLITKGLKLVIFHSCINGLSSFYETDERCTGYPSTYISCRTSLKISNFSKALNKKRHRNLEEPSIKVFYLLLLIHIFLYLVVYALIRLSYLSGLISVQIQIHTKEI